MAEQESFSFRKHDIIGVLDAADDKDTLLNNFINTGDYDVIRNFDAPQRFILGRTGTGKTALILKLIDDEKHIISIDPESLSLPHISNSTLIKELSRLGVNFDIFFRLLWRHVLSVEILKYHFDITTQEAKESVVERLKERFSRLSKRQNHSRGLDYLDSFGSSFWEETDYRVKEIVTSIESNIEAGINTTNPVLTGKIKAGEHLSETQRAEVVTKAQDIVNKVQMKELADILNMLDDAIEDKQKKYFLVVDRLDEKWVEDDLRYGLIKALLETIKDFNVVKKVKPLVVLRNDLIRRVYDVTKDSGFQEEKFSSLNLHVTWDREQLINMLDERVNTAFKRRYTKSKVSYKDILVPTIKKERTIDFLIDRTLMRPRDLISFFNICLEEASGKSTIDQNLIIKAERSYSRDRRTAIRDEWFADFPTLNYWDSMLSKMPSTFKAEFIELEKIEELSLLFDKEKATKGKPFRDLISDELNTVLSEKASFKHFRNYLLKAFYLVGYLGVKLPGYDEPIWSFQSGKTLHIEEIENEPTFYVHKCFWAAFNIHEEQSA